MLKAHFQKWFTALLLIAACAVLASFTLQTFVTAIHQGHHVAQALKKSMSEKPFLDEGSCDTCSVLRSPSETPHLNVFISAPLPLVTQVVSFRPLDPKSNISRTCEARGPPSFA